MKNAMHVYSDDLSTFSKFFVCGYVCLQIITYTDKERERQITSKFMMMMMIMLTSVKLLFGIYLVHIVQHQR